MTLKEFIKKEFYGWNKTEIIGLFTIIGFIITNAYIKHDSPIALISAICGILYTIIAGKGKISCYLFGLTGSSFYGYLAFHNALYGNFLLYVGYYIPMQILGIFKWKKNLNKNTNEIIKTKLPNKERFKLLFITIPICIITIISLYYLKDTSPIIDGITLILSIVGMYLTVRRAIEQWIVWLIVNGLSAIMWINIILHGGKTYSTVIMWLVYFGLAIYFYKKWAIEIYNKTNY